VLRVTSDTNVIVSALNFPGNPSRILDLAATGDSPRDHLLKVGQYQGCKIVTPAEFLKIQSQQGRVR